MILSAVVTSALASVALATDDIPKCGAGHAACPEKYPCCSTDGTCGNGYVCLGGCDPRYSHTPGSCVAMPIFQDTTYNFNGTEGVAAYADYLGDAEKTPFSFLGNITNADDNALRVKLYEGTGGSTVSSSYYLWYGKVTIKMKTSGTGGVVSDVILLSNVKDEIDYEFVGYDPSNAQANYYWQGALDYKNMIKCAVGGNTEDEYHEYTIDWQENQINWSIDGNVVRTLQKDSTKNATTGEYSFPQTPARLQFGLWPGGDSSAQGTSEWAGGKINWSGGQAAQKGYFYVDVKSIKVQPYDPPAGVNKTGSKSYIYTNKDGYENDIAITNDDFVLKATDGTGDDLVGPYGHSSSSSASSSSATSSSASSSSASSSSASSSSASSSSSSPSSLLSASSSSANSSTSSSKSSSPSSRSASPSSSSVSKSDPAGSASKSSDPEASSSSAVVGGAVGAAGSRTATTAPTPSSSSSSKSSSSTKPKSGNAADSLAVPAFAAIIPAFLI